MAEPKKETVRIALPPRPEQAAAAPNIAKRDTARIVLPSRTPVTPIRRLPPKIAPASSSGSTAEAPAFSPRRPLVTPSSAPASSLAFATAPETTWRGPGRNPARPSGARRERRIVCESRTEKRDRADQHFAAPDKSLRAHDKHDQDPAAVDPSARRHAVGPGRDHLETGCPGRCHSPFARLGVGRCFRRDFSDSNFELRRILGDGKFRRSHAERFKF